jgi:hypothetical protein
VAREITRPVGGPGPVIRVEILPVPEQRAALAAQGYRTKPVIIDALVDTGSSNTIIPVGIGNGFGVPLAGDGQNVGLGIGDRPVLAKR